MKHLKELKEDMDKLMAAPKPLSQFAKGMKAVLEYRFRIELALEMLDNQGYYTENLFQLADVQSKYQCSDMIAREVLKDVLIANTLYLKYIKR